MFLATVSKKPLALIDKVKDVECEYGEDKKAEGVGDHNARDLLLLEPVVLLFLLPLPPVGGGPAAHQGDLGSLYVFGMRGPTVVTPLSGGGWAAPLVAPNGAGPAQARRHSRRQGEGVEDQRVQWHGPFPREILVAKNYMTRVERGVRRKSIVVVSKLFLKVGHLVQHLKEPPEN
jgi:hypothetical protein